MHAKSLLDKHLNMEDILEKTLKIKATLKFAGKTMKLKEIKLSRYKMISNMLGMQF